MADIMLVLLIIFMITTPLLQTGITVNLPKAKNPLEAPDADAKDAVVVALDRHGRIFLGKSLTTEQNLMETLRQRFGGGELNKVMFLKADRRSSTGVSSRSSMNAVRPVWRRSA